MKRVFRNPFVLALTLLILFELVLRIFFAKNMEGRFEYGFHPTTGFRGTKNGTVELLRTGGRRFHPQSFSAQRPEGVLRIFTVGDSVPRGPSLQESYPFQLGEELKGRGIKAESFNLGVAGYGARRRLIVLRQALNYQPSLIILHVNNWTEYHDEREFRRSQEFKSWHPKNWLMKSLLVRRLYEAKTEQVFWKWLPQEIRQQNEINDVDAQIVAASDEAMQREWNELVRKCTIESIQLARQAGVPILLLTRASLDYDDAGKPYLNDGGLDEMVALLAGDGVFHLSQREMLQHLDYQSFYYQDRIHLHAPGHAAVAEKIADELISKQVAPSSVRN
ncbi:MAG: hypothetical protein H0X66_22170 [Verrucomicrobia bacterium]|nr:hypothetical protein [Verrucomicrobiota bacterium]